MHTRKSRYGRTRKVKKSVTCLRFKLPNECRSGEDLSLLRRPVRRAWIAAAGACDSRDDARSDREPYGGVPTHSDVIGMRCRILKRSSDIPAHWGMPG